MTETTKISYAQALTEALRMEMHRDPSIVCVATPDRYAASPVLAALNGGFGPERLIAVPAQARPVSIAAGLVARGLRPVCELDAESLGPDALAPLGEVGDGAIVLRVGAGGPAVGGQAPPLEGRLLDTPGLAIASPSNPADAKGMVVAALRRDGASCLIEPEGLFGLVGVVPEGAHVAPIEGAHVAAFGSRASVFAHGAGVGVARDAIANGALEAELVDLRSIRPLDRQAIVASVARTGKAIVVEATGTGRVGAEVAQILLAHAFERLDGPLGTVELDPASAWDGEARSAAVASVAEEIGALVDY